MPSDSCQSDLLTRADAFSNPANKFKLANACSPAASKALVHTSPPVTKKQQRLQQQMVQQIYGQAQKWSKVSMLSDSCSFSRMCWCFASSLCCQGIDKGLMEQANELAFHSQEAILKTSAAGLCLAPFLQGAIYHQYLNSTSPSGDQVDQVKIHFYHALTESDLRRPSRPLQYHCASTSTFHITIPAAYFHYNVLDMSDLLTDTSALFPN